MARSNQAVGRLEAAEGFLVIVLAERTGPLNALQRELLASTLTRVRQAAAILHGVPADTMGSPDASIAGNLAAIAEQPDPQPIADLHRR